MCIEPFMLGVCVYVCVVIVRGSHHLAVSQMGFNGKNSVPQPLPLAKEELRRIEMALLIGFQGNDRDLSLKQ